MKIKQHVVIAYPDRFLAGEYGLCFTLRGQKMTEDGWIYAGEIELDLDVDHADVTATVIKTLDVEIKKERAEHSLKMDMLQTRKDELLALTHEPNPAVDFERDGDA